MGKNFLSLTTPSASTKHYFSTKPLARPTCAVRTTAATGTKINKRVAIQILYFIGLYVMYQHSIHTGCVKHLNDFQWSANRRRVGWFSSNVIVNVFYFSHACHNTLACPLFPPTQRPFGLVTQ